MSICVCAAGADRHGRLHYLFKTSQMSFDNIVVCVHTEDHGDKCCLLAKLGSTKYRLMRCVEESHTGLE